MSGQSHGIRPELRDPLAPRPANDATLVWSDAKLLGFGPMDSTHEEFYQVAFGLLTCEESNMLDALKAVEDHARSHFDQEDSWMETTAFPPKDCHMQEHAAVLSSLKQVHERIVSGNDGVELAHDFATYLFSWFPGHADYLDSALAAWMSKRRFGGKPVILRRSACRV